MTELELFEASQVALSNTLAAFAIFVTMVGAYLTAAYFVGKSLTGSQLLIINFTFVVSMLGMTFVIFAFSSIGFEYFDQSQQVNSSLSFSPPSWIKYFNLGIDLAMIVGCIKFMWDIRSK